MSQRPGSSDDIEIEWQLDALDLRPVERWLAARQVAPQRELLSDDVAGPGGAGARTALVVEPKPAARLVDVYFDTDDWRVGRSGYVLRLRRKGRRAEITLKELASPPSGLLGAKHAPRRRLEATEQLTSAAGDPGDLASALTELGGAGPVGRRVQALVGARRLRPVIEVRTRRRPFALLLGGTCVGELALDETSINVTSDSPKLHLRRVEVEVLAAWVDALSPVVDQLRHDCGLQPAMLSKFEAGLLAAGVSVPRPSEQFSAVAVGPTSSAGELARATIARDSAALLLHEPGTRLGEDPEELHQMRVATRRLRASLSLFMAVLPSRSALVRDELGWLAGLLGSVRDLDVQMGNLGRWAAGLPSELSGGLTELSALLEEERASHRRELLAALDSRRYERLTAGLKTLSEASAYRRTAAARQPAVALVPDLIAARHRAALKAARKAARSGALSDSHVLRIRCKRLRYALEFTGGLYGAEVRPFVKVLARLQDELGLVQDAEAAYHRLQALALAAPTDDEAPLSARTVFSMGLVAQRCRSEAATRLKRVGPGKRILDSPEWRRAWLAMAERQQELADELEAGRVEPTSMVARTVRFEAARPAASPAGPAPPASAASPTPSLAPGAKTTNGNGSGTHRIV